MAACESAFLLRPGQTLTEKQDERGRFYELRLATGQVVWFDREDRGKVSPFLWKLYCAVGGHNFYVVYGRRSIRMHQLLIPGVPRSMRIDHVDGNGLNNRRHNLRVCTPAENALNCKLSAANYSDYRGVTKRRVRGIDKWVAEWTVPGSGDGKGRGIRHQRAFSVRKYGDAEAKRRAIEARTKVIPLPLRVEELK